MDVKNKYVVVLCVLMLVVTLLIGIPVQAQSPTHSVFLPIAVNDYTPPQLEFSHIPACYSYELLTGTTNLSPTSYGIAVYIYKLGGWWTKPHFALPVTPINADGTWATEVNLGGDDGSATKFAAFVIPSGYNPPLAAGLPVLPAELYHNAVIYKIAERSCLNR